MVDFEGFTRNPGSEKIKDKDRGIAVADIAKPVRSATVEKKRIAFMQGNRRLLDLVFDTSFKDILAFEGVRADHLAAAGLFLQFQQNDIRSLGGDAARKNAFVAKPLDRFFREMPFLTGPDEDNMVFVGTVLHVFEKAGQVFFQGVDDIQQHRQRRYRTIILNLRDEPFADTGLLGELFERDILQRPFRLDLVTDEQ